MTFSCLKLTNDQSLIKKKWKAKVLITGILCNTLMYILILILVKKLKNQNTGDHLYNAVICSKIQQYDLIKNTADEMDASIEILQGLTVNQF